MTSNNPYLMLKNVAYPLFYLCLSLLLWSSCENTSTAEENNAAADSLSSESPENTASPQSYCYYGEGLTQIEMNLRIAGNTIQGFAAYVTPKAGMTLFSEYNITGTAKGDVYQLEFTRTDSDDKQGLGESFSEEWKRQGDALVPSEGGVVEQLELQECGPDAAFSAEVQELQLEENTYSYEGTVGRNNKIRMQLTVRTNPKDAQELLLNGNYFYLSQGADKTIALEGVLSQQGVMPGFLYETKDGKTFGKFVIEVGTDLRQAFEASWISADDSKEYPVRLAPQ